MKTGIDSTHWKTAFLKYYHLYYKTHIMGILNTSLKRDSSFLLTVIISNALKLLA